MSEPTIHSALPSPLQVWAREKFFHDGNPEKTDFVQGRIVAVETYPGHAPTFSFLSKEGHLYCYLPVTAFLLSPEEPLDDLPLAVACYANCPEGRVVVSALPLPVACQVFLPSRGSWESGEYVFSLDWWDDNLLLHLVYLSSCGMFALQPNHKIVFGSRNARQFPDWKKCHSEWRV